MNDKIITHADLPMLRRLKYAITVAEHDAEELVDRLIAAAEADALPLPEGWYSWRTDSLGNVHVWHDGNDRLWLYDSGQELFGYIGQRRDRLTPLRPTVTEADVEKAAHRLWIDVRTIGMDLARIYVRAAFAAAGIEVQS